MKTRPIAKSARDRVTTIIAKVRQLRLPSDNCFVLGPRNGDELDQLDAEGVTRINSLDAVYDFVGECRDRGHLCWHGDAEELYLYTASRWNFYCCHVLEHCYDSAAAADQILKRLDRWIYIAAPIEPEPGKNKGHLSPFKTHQAVLDLFPGLEIAHTFVGQDNPRNYQIILEKP